MRKVNVANPKGVSTHVRAEAINGGIGFFSLLSLLQKKDLVSCELSNAYGFDVGRWLEWRQDLLISFQLPSANGSWAKEMGVQA